tara:strand:+ start:2666 stop:3019 length:354 start_codon:yes stop_codon:yes gene_type:complete
MNAGSYKTEHFIVEFSGGDMDGQTLSNRSENEKEKMLAKVFLTMTNSGEPGKGMKGLSFSAMLQGRELEVIRSVTAQNKLGNPVTKLHAYHVVDRVLADGVYHVRVKYQVVDNGRAG